MLDDRRIQEMYRFVMRHFIEKGKAPHFTEVAVRMDLEPDEAKVLQHAAADAGVGSWSISCIHCAEPVTVVMRDGEILKSDPVTAVGHMYAFEAATGEEQWSFVSGGSCNAGAAIVDGTVHWGSGYAALAGSLRFESVHQAPWIL